MSKAKMAVTLMAGLAAAAGIGPGALGSMFNRLESKSRKRFDNQPASERFEKISKADDKRARKAAKRLALQERQAVEK